jgi:[acyl-carrier-protein] S-malonyltransferase
MSEQLPLEGSGSKPFQNTEQPLTLSGTVAWAFAGQGSQIPGMGRDIYEAFSQTQDIFESTAAGFDLKETCFNAPAEVLGDTRYTQACMAAFAAAVVRVLTEAGHTPDVALGLSLGEYNALHAAGVFDVDTLLALLGFRGAIMADASNIASRMTAVLGLEDETVEATVVEVAAKTGGIVSCTNYNSTAQVVIGGEEAAVQAAEELLIECGARRCMPLKTSGPFHTALMQGPAELLAARLADTELKPQKLPVLFNVTAAPAADSEVRELLTKQIYSPVRFAQSIRALEAAGITEIIEIGPGKVLAGLIKKTAPSIAVRSIENADDLREVLGS